MLTERHTKVSGRMTENTAKVFIRGLKDISILATTPTGNKKDKACIRGPTEASTKARGLAAFHTATDSTLRHLASQENSNLKTESKRTKKQVD